MRVLALLFACGSCGQPTSPGSLVDRDSDGYTADIDCDDQNPNVNPAAEELCDELDNDCDSFIDEPGAIGAVEWFADVDQDGYGDASSSQTTCTQPEDYIADNRDCNDLDPFIYPNAPEYCDGVDNDCDELTDEDSALDSTVFFRDVDGDGFGNPFISDRRCFEGNGYVDNDTDCNDSEPLINPNGAEICDGVDNDCDLLVDDQDVDVQDALSWYADIDGDGYGSGAPTLACEAPFFFMVADSTDCNDQEAAISPAAIEWCGDGIDNDCDLLVDVDDSDAVAVQWYTDDDGDGYGNADSTLGFSCDAIPGGSALVDDCDDTDPSISPNTPEIWYDGIDQDCAGGDDFDADLDGVPLAEDCDDDNADVRPGIPDTCGSQVDENCDSVVDICQLSGQMLDGSNVGDEWGSALLVGPITDSFSDQSFWVAGPGDDDSAVGAGSVMLLPFAGPDFAQPTINIVGEALADHIGTELITTEFGLGSGLSAAPELWISSYGSDLNGHNAGAVYWLNSDPADLLALSSDGVTVLLSDVPDRLLGNAAGDYFGWSISSRDASDSQVLIGAPMASTGSLGLVENGTAYLFSETDLLGGTQLAQTAPHQFIGINSGDQSATSVGLGDVNGDGLSDAIIGSPYHSQGQYEGLVSIDLAPFGQLNLLADAEGQWRGDLPNSNIGTSIAVGDVNADGFDDVVIGAPYRDGDNGAVYVVYGPGVGSYSVAQADISLLPHEDHTLLGSKVWVVDLDQDGALDVVGSAPNADTQLPSTGAVLGIHGPLSAAESFDWVLYSSDTGDQIADSLLPTDSGFLMGSARRATGNGGLMWVEWVP